MYNYFELPLALVQIVMYQNYKKKQLNEGEANKKIGNYFQVKVNFWGNNYVFWHPNVCVTNFR